MAIGKAEASVAAQNTFTSTVKPVGGYLNLSISGTWAGTVTLQRSFDSGSTYVDVATYAANAEKAIEDKEDVIYRVGIKTGEYTSGTAVLRLSA